MLNRISSVLIACLLLWTNSSAQNIEHLADSLMAEHVGGGILLIHEGETILKKSYGHADLENEIQSSSNTNYRLASITKQFIAFAILLLEENNSLDLSDTLPKYFPEYPAYGKEITVEDLLQHLSGIPDYARLTPDSTTLQLSDFNALQLLLDESEADHGRRTVYEYSNSGYVLLGLIIEQASGQTLRSYLRDHIFSPLNMPQSMMYERGLNNPSFRAYGHVSENDMWHKDDQSIYSALRGDGGIYSSLDDLETWVKALDEKKLLSEKSYKLMYAPPEDVDTIYALGWRVDSLDGRIRYRHSGSTKGFRNDMHRLPESNSAVVILTNDSVSISGKAELLIQRFLEKIQND